MPHFNPNNLKSQPAFQVQRVLNSFLVPLKWHFSDSGKQRRERGKPLEGACAAFILCLNVDNFSSDVQNLAVKYKHEGIKIECQNLTYDTT